MISAWDASIRLDSSSSGTTSVARRVNSHVPVLVRTRDDSQLAELQAAGATEVVPELLESSLMLASHALIMLGLPEQRVRHHVDQVRHERYGLLHGFYPGNKDKEP